MIVNAPSSNELDVAAGVLRLMADKTRLSILALLHDGEMSVGAIAEELGRPVPAVSQHLAKLRMANMVQTRKEGTSCFYSQPDEHLTSLVINALHFAEHTLYDQPPHHRAQS
ncbi:ArsR/SmtB family transcription factor [Corynebacterium lactis]|uniref:ArsR family transcriptional regulator n=1 Tax=Corynebacterium lactis RW2-5 TaxID=1408189 RepID=A0A0K2H053_9CORY|nr:metalloregulator ArsR/SmtB family transcription factor [Corynebacterium lactis]ALA67420.1 ArsR family transcriptional regulator [Corynebacterium lactis RW2-5]